jgi:hypothetical protein
LASNFGIELTHYKYWADISDYFKIRNGVIHANGDVSIMNLAVLDAAKRQAAAQIKVVSLVLNLGNSSPLQ